MKRFLLLLIVLLPALASGQKFVANLDVNVYGSASTLKPAKGLMKAGDQVVVEKMQYNGWCYVTINDTQQGYVKIKRLDPVDEAAAEMKALADKRVKRETQTVVWSIIIVLATLVLSMITKRVAPKIQVPVLMAGVLAVSIVEILFFLGGYEFTFYSPFVLGSWGKAALYFIPFVIFIGLQMYLWLTTLMLIAGKANKEQGGCILTIVVMVVMFVAFILAIFLNKEALWNPYIFWGLVISQIVQAIIFFIYYVKTPLIALEYVVIYLVGFTAVIYLAMHVVEVLILGVFVGATLSGSLKAATTRQVTVDTATGKKTKWEEGVDITDAFKGKDK